MDRPPARRAGYGGYGGYGMTVALPNAGWTEERCFGCLTIQDVTPVGTLTAGGVPVTLRVCSWCLDHLEAWHRAETTRSRSATDSLG